MKANKIQGAKTGFMAGCHIYMRLMLLALLVMLWGGGAVAADYQFQHIHSGLPHQQVEALEEDIDGNIWIGTRNGLCRYNGYGLYTYQHDDADTTSIQHNFIHQLLRDSRGRLWIRTHKGVSRYDPMSDSFRNYPSNGDDISALAETSGGHIVYGAEHLFMYNERDDRFEEYPSLDFGYIVSLCPDANGDLYVSTNNAVYCYKAGLTRISTMPTEYFSDFLTGEGGIVAMTCDSRGRLWISRNGQGVEYIEPGTGRMRVYGAGELSDGVVRCITEDRYHRVWLGTEHGITVVHPDGRTEQILHYFNEPSLLSDNAVYAILSDSRGNMWVGSFFGGVDMLPARTGFVEWYKPGYAANSLRGKVPRQMVRLDDSNIWVATEDGGINILDLQTGNFSLFGHIGGMGTNIHTLYHDPAAGEMWIGTFRHGLFRYDLSTHTSRHYLYDHGMNSNSVFSIARQRNGTIWVGTASGLLRYDPQADRFTPTGNDILDTNFIFTLTVDTADNLWIGTYSDGLFSIDAKTGKARRWNADDPASHLRDQSITALFADSRNHLYIGTGNNGLQRMDLADRSIYPIELGKRRSSATVCAIIEDKAHGIWVTTSDGLYKLNADGIFQSRYTTYDGLPTDQFNFASTLLLPDGRLLLGTVHGLVCLDPRKNAAATSPLAVHLFRLTIQNDDCRPMAEGSPLEVQIDKTKRLELSYDQARSFSIEFGAIMPGHADNIGYQVRLVGIDTEWHDISKERKFYGYNIPDGSYTLQIRASNAVGMGWDNCPIRELEIVVSPPFYRSAWAYILYLALAATAIFMLYRHATDRLKKSRKERAEQAERSQQEAVNKSKIEFFTTISHELKTPLSLIIAPLKSISRESLTEQGRRYIGIAVSNATKMKSLIEQLVTFNRIGNGEFPFYLQKSDPLPFIKKACESFIVIAKNKDIVFSVDTEDNGEDVWFSPSYVEKIIDNLLSNAFKFTPEGGEVNLTASITTTGGHSGHTYLRISVADTGIGIAPEERDRIFKLYYQTRRGVSANHAGWGIGLSLVKRLTEIHHGTIELESTMGKGSCFTVSLDVSPDEFDKECYTSNDASTAPLADYQFAPQQAEPTAIQAAEPASAALRQSTTLLIVDDNDDLRNFLSTLFAQTYNVLTASDGTEGLRIATENAVDMVISDVMMPGIDGVELCRRLKSDVATSHIPVILLTAKTATPDMKTGYQSGAEAYVAKPFDPQILELQVKNILALCQKRQADILQSTATHIETDSLGQLDRDFIDSINSLIDTNMANSDFSVQDITGSLAVSRSLLHRKMKALVGLSITEYIRKRRLNMACQLLQQGYNVSETAYRTGFADPSYFSKTFKKILGISPSDYLDSTQEQ